MGRFNRVLGMAAVAALIAAPALAQDLEKGKAVYEAQKCSLCHSVGGRGNAKGPLDKVGAKLSADDIKKWITTPKEMKSETGRKPEMRAYPSLPAADLDALVAYMKSLKG